MDDTMQGVPSETGAAVPDIGLTPAAQNYLNQTRPWVRFLSVLIFVGTCLMALTGIAFVIAGLVGGMAVQREPALGPFKPVTALIPLGLFYMIGSILYIPAGVFLARYASAIASLELDRSAAMLENAIKYQKSFWRYIGILTLAVLIVTVLAVVLGIIFSILVLRSHRGGI